MSGIQTAIEQLEEKRAELLDKVARIDKVITDLRALDGAAPGKAAGKKPRATKKPAKTQKGGG